MRAAPPAASGASAPRDAYRLTGCPPPQGRPAISPLSLIPTGFSTSKHRNPAASHHVGVTVRRVRRPSERPRRLRPATLAFRTSFPDAEPGEWRLPTRMRKGAFYSNGFALTRATSQPMLDHASTPSPGHIGHPDADHSSPPTFTAKPALFARRHRKIQMIQRRSSTTSAMRCSLLSAVTKTRSRSRACAHCHKSFSSI